MVAGGTTGGTGVKQVAWVMDVDTAGTDDPSDGFSSSSTTPATEPPVWPPLWRRTSC
jgi:hypothetical protein